MRLWVEVLHRTIITIRADCQTIFYETLPAADQAFRAVNTFKDEYLLDYINVEELGIRDREDIDEKVVENAIIHNVKMFILTFGKDFTFVRNQYHLDAFWRGPIYRSFIFLIEN